MPTAWVYESVGSVLGKYLGGEAVKADLRPLELREKGTKPGGAVFDFDGAVGQVLDSYVRYRKNSQEQLFYLADINQDGTLEMEEVARV